MVNYKAFVKKFIWWYVGANVVLAVLFAIFMPNILGKIFSGQEVTVAEITSLIVSPAGVAPATQHTMLTVEPVEDANLTRVKRLSAGINVGNIVIAECEGDVDHNILGCYVPQSKVVNITQLGLSQTDSQLQCVLRHEARHKWQHDTGKIVFNTLGGIENREALEADAYANDGC